jgi:hypothetical protein
VNIEAKDFPVLDGAPTEEHPYGTFEVVLSAPTLDRDGEVIDTRAFDPLPDHISFDTDHSMTCDSVVGSGVPYYAEDGTLRVKGGYCSDARSQTIRQKVAEGHIRTTSVTFMAAKRSKDDKDVTHITAGELLNGTFTPIPSNREAVVLAAKSIVSKAGRRNSASDAALIKAIHDATVALGAHDDTDESGSADDPASGKDAADAAETTELNPNDESAVTADESAADNAADSSAAAADEVPDEVKAAMAARRNQITAAFL